MQQEKQRRSNAERTQSTRDALLEAARRLFVDKSYAGTSTPDIVAAAKVTRGALYHHFADKMELFRAVVERECAMVADEIDAASPEALEPLEALQRGGAAYMRAMAEHGRTRLLLLDGPAVLGRDMMDEIDARHGARTLKSGLAAAMEAGAIVSLSLEATTDLLGAAFDRAALTVAGGADPEDYRKTINRLIAGLAPG